MSWDFKASSPLHERIKALCPGARVAVKPHRQCFFIAHGLGVEAAENLRSAGFSLIDVPNGGIGLTPPLDMIEQALAGLPELEGKPFLSDYLASLVLRAVRRSGGMPRSLSIGEKHIDTALWACDAPRMRAQAERARSRYLSELAARMEMLLDEPPGGQADALLACCAHALIIVGSAEG